MNNPSSEAEPNPPESNPAFLACLTRAQENLLVVLDFLTERAAKDPLLPSLLEEAADLCRRPAAQLTPAEQRRIWPVLDALSIHIEPATIEGLRLTATNSQQRAVPWWLQVLVVLLLIVTLATHGYTLFGARAIESIDRRSEEQLSVFEQINRMQQANPDLVLQQCASQCDPSCFKDVTYLQLCWRNQAIDAAKRSDYHSMFQWNALWAAWVAGFNRQSAIEYWGCECLNGAGPCPMACSGSDSWPMSASLHARRDVQVKYGNEATARAALVDLNNLILPMLYSLLGASVWLIRNRLERIRQRRLRAALAGELWQRMTLGAVLGGIVGAVAMSPELTTPVDSIPLLGLAFVVGYNVELVFSFIDRMIGKYRDALSATPPAASAAPPPPPPPPPR